MNEQCASLIDKSCQSIFRCTYFLKALWNFFSLRLYPSLFVVFVHKFIRREINIRLFIWNWWVVCMWQSCLRMCSLHEQKHFCVSHDCVCDLVCDTLSGVTRFHQPKNLCMNTIFFCRFRFSRRWRVQEGIQVWQNRVWKVHISEFGEWPVWLGRRS